MPQLQNLVLTDRAATPVVHTFTPINIDANGVGTVAETGTVPVGEPKFSIQNKRVNGRFKVTLKLSVPVVQTQTINGISTPTVVRTAYVDATFTFDGAASEQERKDIVGMFQSSLDPAKVLVNDTLIKLQGVY